ncbi:efflux RND transporter periplasmic adaptor subunit [soil metagenome]
MKRSYKLLIVTLIIVIIISVIILPRIFKAKEKEPPQSQNPQNNTTSADGYILTTSDLANNIKTIGTIRANEEVEIRSEVSRKVRAIYFKEGSYVGKGSVLVKLDDSDLQSKLKRSSIDEELAQLNVERTKTLLDKGLAAQSTYDIDLNTLAKVQADMDGIRIDISKTVIRAPFSGFTGLRNISVGTYLTPATIVTTMQDISRIKIDFSIPEKYLGAFKKGDNIIYTVDGSNEEFLGEVYASEPKVENNTRTLTLRAISTNNGKKLLPGTFTSVTLKLSNITAAMMIPTQSLIPNITGQSVLLMKNGIAKLIPVDIGIRTEDKVQIMGQITAGDTIVATNILKIKPDSKVKITNLIQ